jgi:nitrogen PTS system EIIA component
MQLTVRDAAHLLELGEDEIYRFIHEHEIPFYEVNDQFRFNRAELLAWATSTGRRVSAAAIHELGGSSAPAGLVEALSAGGIYRDVDASDYASMVRAVVERLPIRDAGEREFVAGVLAAANPARASVGDGIAVPHARSPIILHGCGTALSLCFLVRPIPGGSKGEAISTIFMIVAPTPKAHLQILSRLSTALLDPAYKAAIQRRAPNSEIVEEAGRIDAAVAARHPSRPHG